MYKSNQIILPRYIFATNNKWKYPKKKPKFEFLLVVCCEAAAMQVTVDKAEEWRGTHMCGSSGGAQASDRNTHEHQMSALFSHLCSSEVLLVLCRQNCTSEISDCVCWSTYCAAYHVYLITLINLGNEN
jgi:hypothetical protein